MLIDFYNLSAALKAELEEAKKINEISEKALKLAMEASQEIPSCHVKNPPISKTSKATKSIHKMSSSSI